MKKFSMVALILVLALTVVLSISLVACGPSDFEKTEITFKIEGQQDQRIHVSDSGEITFPNVPETADRFFIGWALDDDTPVDKNYFKGKTLPANITIVAKFYTLGSFGAMPTNFAIKETGDIDVSKLSGIVSASDGSEVAITAEVSSGTRTGGQKVTVKVTATGQQGIKKTKEFTGIKVYGKPTITDVLNKKMREDTSLTNRADLRKLNIKITDSFGVDVPFTATKTKGEQVGGQYMDFEITATDALGNTTTKTFADMKVYGRPSLTYNGMVKEIYENQSIDDLPLSLQAKDSFEEEILSVKTEIVSGNKDIDSTLVIKATAKDSLNNVAEQNISLTVLEDQILSFVDGYVLFGSYPNTVKHKTINILNQDAPNSKGYYLGSDGLLYAKRTTGGVIPDAKFSNGESISASTPYYFKVERILWKRLKTEGNSWFLFSEDILDGMRFDATEPYSNVYADNDIDTWLNGEFLEKAFSTQQQSIIKQKPDADGIFILNETQATNESWGFNVNTERQKFTSDYSRANAVSFNADTHKGNWWLSTSSANEEMARRVMGTGEIGDASIVVPAGIVPALWINIPIA